MKAASIITAGVLILWVGMSIITRHNPSKVKGVSLTTGDARIRQHWQTGKVELKQSSNVAIINLNGLALDDIAIIKPPGATTLVRVNSKQPTRLYGDLSKKSGIMIVNPNGIIVGPTGAIDLKPNLVKSTLEPGNIINGSSVFDDNSQNTDNPTLTVQDRAYTPAVSKNSRLILRATGK